MGFEHLIGLRYLCARRKERFVSLIALISLGGVTLGTFTLTVVLSVMSGFQEDLRQRLLAFNPELTIQRTDGTQWDSGAMAKKIAAIPGVVGVAPFVAGQVMAVSGAINGSAGYVSGGMLRGILPENNPVLTELEQTLTAGGLKGLQGVRPVKIANDGATRVVNLPGVIIGKSLALDLGVRLGDPLTLLSPVSLVGGLSAPRLKRFVVTGFFYSGMAQYDDSLVFVSLREGSLLLSDDPQLTSGLEVRVRDLFAAPEIGWKIRKLAGPGFETKNWTETDASLFAALKLEKLTYFLVLLLIVLVAAFNIVATLVMVVMERRKEIAILRAMGARASSIASIFLFQGSILGLVGTTLGVGSGYICSFLIGKYHLIKLSPDVFMVSSVPVRLYAGNFIAVALAAIALCLCAAIYPALEARSMSPVEVIRYE